MCGIGGIVERANGGRTTVSNLLHMSSHIAHRGPDDEGYLIATDAGIQNASGQSTNPSTRSLYPDIHSFSGQGALIGLLHRRLSIFDVSAAGWQPMAYHNQSLHITFNGAIYNFPELKEQLAGLGHAFNTHTDTEVLLAAYLEWGERMVNFLEGMWAFVIYDSSNQLLFGSRDRFGVKPFYYIYDDQYFAFASEQKALYSLPFVDQRVSRTGAFHFLVMGEHSFQNEGLLKAVLELMPGDAFTYNIQTHALKLWQYYKLPASFKWHSFKESQFRKYRDSIRELLAHSVKLHLRSDVSLGACLSGGLDSAALVSMASTLRQSQNQDPLKVFTAVFPGFRANEEKFASYAVRDSKADWYKVNPTATDFQSDIEDFFLTHDLPLQTPSTYAQYAVMREANRQGVKVTLDGQGADEVFGGYHSQFLVYFLELLKRRQYSEAALNYAFANGSFASKGAINTFLLKTLVARFTKRPAVEALYRNKHPELGLLRNSFWDKHKKDLNTQVGDFSNSLNEILFEQTTGSVMASHLRMADRNSMRFGVEARVPFADSTKLIELMFSMPPIYKIQRGTNKFMLRSALKGIVAPEIMTRRDKIGFQAPDGQWIKASSQLLKSYITRDMDEYVNVKKLLQEWDQHINAAAKGESLFFWRIISLAIWRKVVIKK